MKVCFIDRIIVKLDYFFESSMQRLESDLSDLSEVRCSVDRAVALVDELSSKQHLVEERLRDLDFRCARLKSALWSRILQYMLSRMRR